MRKPTKLLKSAILGIVIILPVLLVGCSDSDVKTIKADTQQLTKDAGPILKNSVLATKVNTHLSLHKGIDMSGLHIETRDNQVTVGGHVRNESMRKTVLAVVRETTGVEKTIDNLRIEK